MKVKVVNTEDRATVPIAIEVTGQAETNGHWDKASTLLHPAAFVLNKKEQREITKLWRVPADAARTTLMVKEQESGNLLKTEQAEKVFRPARRAGYSKAVSSLASQALRFGHSRMRDVSGVGIHALANGRIVLAGPLQSLGAQLGKIRETSRW